jgi:polysaccharide export outer membrane protein
MFFRMLLFVRRFAQEYRALAVAVLVAGWWGNPHATAAPNDSKPGGRLATYKLRPMDLVKVQVFQEPDLDRELRVSQDYTVVVPLIGVVDVKDRTVRETELLITGLYQRDYLVNPQINITVVEYSQRTVNVLGAVNSPGSVSIPPEKTITLLDAIARSGGFSRLANRNKVSLTRTLADGQTVNYTIDADQLVSGDKSNRAPVQDGDVVFVPERML